VSDPADSESSSGSDAEDQVYRCEACGDEFDSADALEAHVRRVGLAE
jgi:hypothetical protein